MGRAGALFAIVRRNALQRLRSSDFYVHEPSLIIPHKRCVSVMLWVRDRRKIGQELGRKHGCKDDFEYWDLMESSTWVPSPVLFWCFTPHKIHSSDLPSHDADAKVAMNL